MRRLTIVACAGLALGVIGLASAAPTPTPTPEKEGKVAGTAKERGNGTWIGIEIVDQHFRMTFYDANKKPVAADVPSAVLWWPVQYQPNNERTELVATDNPDVLSSEKVIRPPFHFKLHVTFLGDANAGASHTYGQAPANAESCIVDFDE